MRLGLKYSHKKTDTRAFILSSELFPPNVAKSGTGGNLSVPIQPDVDRMKRVIEFIANKRTKDDIVVLFDGRSRQCRKIIELAEEKLAASGAHNIAEFWYVYVVPSKQADPRVPGRQTTFAANNREAAICSLPKKTGLRVLQRAEFNSCGESSTSATTYTGIPMRHFRELPRMDAATKESILGGTAAQEAGNRRRLNKDILARGHPFSTWEVKPITLWQRILEHHGVTHVVDFSPGSAGLAIAAVGTCVYEGVAANEVHREWLDSTVDRCVMYMVGSDQEYAKGLGGDDEFAEKAHSYFAGTMLEARRLMGQEEMVQTEEAESSEESQ